MVVARGWGRGTGELAFNRDGASVLRDEEFLEMDGGDGYTTK